MSAGIEGQTSPALAGNEDGAEEEEDDDEEAEARVINKAKTPTTARILQNSLITNSLA